jgi:phosphomannomutase
MLTPFAAHCLGAAFARWLLLTKLPPKIKGDDENVDDGGNHTLRICVGRDPRCHGERLCDSFARGAEGVGGGVVVAYTGLATTPSMYEFVRSGMCDAAVMGECGGPVFFSATMVYYLATAPPLFFSSA